MSDEEPKLIIDDDWKEQVLKEKEKLAEAEADDAKKPATDSSSDASTGDGEIPPPPPASFDMLVTMLASQALMSMGQVPNPATGEAEQNKDYAKHYIDTLSMLEEKTKNNLSDDEAAMLTQTLHQLRMLFISA